MAGSMKRLGEWLGVVSQDRYADEYDDTDGEITEQVPRDDDRRYDRSSARGVERYDRTEESVVTPIDRRRPSGTAVQSGGSGAQSGAQSSSPTTTSPRTADLTRIITVHPRTYNEARTIGEHFRDGVPVIMNLTEMEDVDAKRLVDFAAGLVFGLHGSIERVTSKVFLLSPENVEVSTSGPEVAKATRGLFNQS